MSANTWLSLKVTLGHNTITVHLAKPKEESKVVIPEFS